VKPSDPRWKAASIQAAAPAKVASPMVPSIHPVGPLKRVDNNRYMPAILWARDIADDVKKFSDTVSKTGVEDPRILNEIREGIEGVCDSLGWAVTIRRY